MKLEPPQGRLIRAHLAQVAREIERGWGQSGPVQLDLSAVQEVDSAGAALLSTLEKRARAGARNFEVVGLSPQVSATLRVFPSVPDGKAVERPYGWLEDLGEKTAKVGEVALEYLLLVADVWWFFWIGLFHPRGMRWKQVVYEMSLMGSRALGVVGLISFLVGG